MNKSHLGTADNPQDLVTSHDIGRLVDVTNVGKGFLRYVGQIHGKDGIFCGIELLEPNGKHDGTFQGVSYFLATPNHGIFAPIFRVTLDADERHKQPEPMKTANRLSRSALPALQLRNPLTQESPDIMTQSIYAPPSTKPISIPKCRPPETDPMQMSMFSDMMDGSMFSNGSWSDIADSMITSNCTFTVRKGPMIPPNIDDDSDLMSVPMVKSVFNIDREALRREEQLQSSIILGESRIGVEHLPIIEDDNELETPLVETRPIASMNDMNANIETKTPIVDNTICPNIKIPINNGNHVECHVSPQYSVTSSSHESDFSTKKDNSDGEEGVNEKNDNKKKANQKETDKKSMDTAPPPVKKTPAVVAPPVPVAPKFPVKPKAPSKHQIMMEQLKASIEAEKNKPKKEVKSRVSLLPPAPTTATPTKVQKENKDGVSSTEMAETPKRSIMKQPLKTVNKTKTSPAPPVERVKKERKPLYVAPPPKERVEKEKKVVAPTTVSPPSSKDGDNTKRTTSSISSIQSTSKKEFPTSSFAGGKLASRNTSISSTKTKKQASIDEKEKLMRLQQSSQAFDAIILTMKHMDGGNQLKMEDITRKYERKVTEINDLKKLLEEANKRFDSELETIKAQNQQVIRNHATTLDDVRKQHETQMNAKSKEYERSIEDERARQEAEMCAMSNRHQKVILCLDEKIAEAEKQCEQLKNDKKALQAALANDCDHRNQMLTKEISSLQTALEMKSAEMKELRQKNQNLSLQVDEIPLKELEISKWKHKSNEYKQMLDQKINGEKILVQQIEDLRRKQLHDEEEKEAMKRSFDLMQFKLENGDEPNTLPTESRFSTPTKVQFRSRSSASGTRPPSITMTSSTPGDHRMSVSSSQNGDHDPMNRSTLSMYMSQVRLPENHADDVIYAPDEIISSRSGSISQRLAIAIEDDGEPTLKTESNDQSDSGIGLVM